MAQLIVRNLEEKIVFELKRRAVEHGVSAEEEHREILRKALRAREKSASIKSLLRKMPDVGDDEDFKRVSDVGRGIDL